MHKLLICGKNLLFEDDRKCLTSLLDGSTLVQVATTFLI